METRIYMTTQPNHVPHRRAVAVAIGAPRGRRRWVVRQTFAARFEQQRKEDNGSMGPHAIWK